MFGSFVKKLKEEKPQFFSMVCIRKKAGPWPRQSKLAANAVNGKAMHCHGFIN
jgi:hypothetical protein